MILIVIRGGSEDGASAKRRTHEGVQPYTYDSESGLARQIRMQLNARSMIPVEIKFGTTVCRAA